MVLKLERLKLDHVAVRFGKHRELKPRIERGFDFRATATRHELFACHVERNFIAIADGANLSSRDCDVIQRA